MTSSLHAGGQEDWGQKKGGWGKEGGRHVPKLIALIFRSSIFLSHIDVVSIQDPGFSGVQNGGKASFGSQPDKHGMTVAVACSLATAAASLSCIVPA